MSKVPSTLIFAAECLSRSGLSPKGPVTYGAPADGSPVHTGANPATAEEVL